LPGYLPAMQPKTEVNELWLHQMYLSGYFFYITNMPISGATCLALPKAPSH